MKSVSSDCSGSEDSGPEEQLNEDEEEESEGANEACALENTTPAPTNQGVLAGGDAVGWPVRPSLFPNVPPYIKFTSHEAEAPVVIPVGKRLFKWKLSTITPVLVRKTLTNSGFSMVRSEFSRGVPPFF